MPFGKLSRRPASTLVRFADRDPIDGMGMCCGGDQKSCPSIVTSVHDLFSKVNWYRVIHYWDSSISVEFVTASFCDGLTRANGGNGFVEYSPDLLGACDAVRGTASIRVLLGERDDEDFHSHGSTTSS
jgi:hypothetical protein